LSGRAAGDEHAHARRDLALDQRAEPLLIDRAGSRKGGNEGGPAAPQPAYVLRHGSFLSVSRASAQMSSSMSAKAYMPRRPVIERAPSSAPPAKPSRERAVCTNSTWSAAESSPTRCTPGMSPARVLVTPTLPPSSR